MVCRIRAMCERGRHPSSMFGDLRLLSTLVAILVPEISPIQVREAGTSSLLSCLPPFSGAAATTQAAAAPTSKPIELSTSAAPPPALGVFGKIATGMGGVVKSAADAGAALIGGATAALGVFGGATPTLVAAPPKAVRYVWI